MNETANKKLLSILIHIMSFMFYFIAVSNIVFQKNGGISLSENRMLATMPEISIENIQNKSFPHKFDNFVSDNFIYRDSFIDLSERLHGLYSLDSISKNDSIAFLNNNFITENDVITEDIDYKEEPIKKATPSGTLFAPYSVTSRNLGEEVERIDMQGSYILYKGVPYFTGYSTPEYYQRTAKAINSFIPYIANSKFAVMPVPTRSAFIEDKRVIKSMGDQKEDLKKFLNLLDNKIKKINLYDILKEHEDEYLYYYSDHHWTALGCYYGYVEYCKHMGIEPYPLSHFKETLLTENFVGTVHSYTKDIRTRDLKDVAYAYLPQKKCTMTRYDLRDKVTYYEDCIGDYQKGYRAFIDGDAKLCIVNVPENDEKDTLLIIKDSYANGIVPFLVEHYGKIVVFDPRYTTYSVHEFMNNVKEEPVIFKDMLILTHYFETNFMKWPDQLLRSYDINDHRVFDKKDAIVYSFMADFYNYIHKTSGGTDFLIKNDIGTFDDFTKLIASLQDGSMPSMTDRLCSYFFHETDNLDIENQFEYESYISNCLKNNYYTDLIYVLYNNFNIYKKDSIKNKKSKEKANFFKNAIDTMKYLSYVFYSDKYEEISSNLPLAK